MLNTKFPMHFGKPTTMVDQIYKALGKAISEGDLKAGSELKETELQQVFGVSRAPIREAIRLLEADGLILIDSYKKKCVRNITRNDIEETIPVLIALSVCGGAIATDRIKAEEIETLREYNHRMEKEFLAEKAHSGEEYNSKFHELILKASGNEVLKKNLRTLFNSVIKVWLIDTVSRSLDVAIQSVSEHKKIIQGFEERDKEKVSSTLRTHLSNMLQYRLTHTHFDSEGFYLSA